MEKPKPTPEPKGLCSVAEHRKRPDAAGIDLGAQEAVVAVPPGRDPQPVRTFSTFTPDLHQLRDWLRACGVTSVALESTGNYWVAVYEILEEAGVEVCLINPQQLKRRGKKTDVCDAQWLQEMHAAGLLDKSFRPAKEIVPLRYLLRHRASLVQSAAHELQHMQKVCQEMNLHLHHVLSDLDGESGRRILQAILKGERDPATLADLRDRRCQTPRAKVIAALTADYRAEYLFVLQQCFTRWEQTQASIGELDQQLAAWLVKVPAPCPAPEAGTLSPRRVRKNTPRVPLQEEGWRFFGVDLTAIDGISTGALAVLMTELGTREHIRQAFASGRALASWLGLCPDNRITGGRVQATKTRKVQSRVATALRLAAQGLSYSKSQLGDFCRRMKARLGKAEGITATAHKLARIIYALISTQQPYQEQIAFQLTPQRRASQVANLHRQAAKLGYVLAPQTTLPTPQPA
jgi:transposase